MTIKLCDACYAAEYPNTKPRIRTWGRQCSSCHKPTPSLATLIKVEQ